MIDDFFYLDEGTVRVTAASVGISKSRWTSVRESDIKSGEYKSVMRKRRFDHLPIIAENDKVYEYFKTDEPNKFDTIKRHPIAYDDVIPVDTNVRTVIEEFARTKRTFYFLSYQKRITGLITVGNLNCKQVQVYVFSLICDLERALADFVNNKDVMSDQDIKDYVKSKIKTNNSDNNHKEEISDKFKKIHDKHQKLELSGLENKITELFYFVDFFNLITERELYKKLGYSKSEWKDQNSINEIRQRVAHPTRSLLDKDNDIEKLDGRLSKIEDVLFRLYSLR